MILELCLFALTAFICFSLFKRNKNLPPGPWRLPLVGNAPLLTIAQCHDCREKYGDVFMTQTGIVPFIYIADYKLAKEAFSKTEFSNRPGWSLFHIFEEEKKNNASVGVILSSGIKWHNSRRFLLRHLRDLGMGKSKIEDIIMKEVEDLVQDFKSLTDAPSKLPFSLNVAVLNIIWQLVAGHRYEFDDKKVKDLMNNVNEVQDQFIFAGISDFFPILNIIPKGFFHKLIGRDKLQKTINKFKDLVQPFIDEHMSKLDVENPVDLMDEYLIEMTTKKNEEFSHFCNDDLGKTTFDLFVAGNDTTSNMTRWILIYMAKFPEIQKKVQQELEKVVPSGTLPGLEHREKLAYLDATINEVQRHSSLISFGVFRCTTTDVTLNGYHIPKDACVFALQGLFHKDPFYWENPKEFDPTRFLDENGKFMAQREGFMPFGIGKRQCLGESFARMELFLINAALLQNFSFRPAEGTEIDTEPTNCPQTHVPNKDNLFCIKRRIY